MLVEAGPWTLRTQHMSLDSVRVAARFCLWPASALYFNASTGASARICTFPSLFQPQVISETLPDTLPLPLPLFHLVLLNQRSTIQIRLHSNLLPSALLSCRLPEA